MPESAILLLITLKNFFFSFSSFSSFSYFPLFCLAHVQFSVGFSLSRGKVEVLLLSELCLAPEMKFISRRALTKLRIATISFVMSVLLSAWNNRATIGLMFMKFDIRVFF